MDTLYGYGYFIWILYMDMDTLWILYRIYRISVCELTVCHETNLQISRDYKLNKYANLASSRSSLVSHIPVRVYTIEVSTLGFVAAEPNFFKDCAIPFLSNTILTEIIKTTALASHDIYGKR